jgi:5-methyltetrahydropteroyltriglutamate--homocysteine methyltransferase
VITDGEQRRDNFVTFVCGKIAGLEKMTLAQLLDHVEDKASFEAMLQALDVPAFAIRNPVAVGPLSRRESLAVEDARFLRAHTKKPIKVTLPGPYILARSSYVQGLSNQSYPTREMMSHDIVKILREEVKELAELGVDVIQFDEPVLTELVFAGKSATRTFMCGALAAKADPKAELEFAVSLINKVTEGISGDGKGNGPITSVHVCRGNWSTKDEVLLAGPYDPLIETFAKMKIGQLALEYATPRAGALDVLKGLPASQSVGVGAVDPRTSEVESLEAVVEKAKRAADVLGKERVWLNPDCGFATFSERPVNVAEIAQKKLAQLAAAAKSLR